ncbi:MAG: hypothetical protein KIT83_13625 [Bryobacterales bacterium]|nr:hypothetical protein [Bryobacterales bacterium]
MEVNLLAEFALMAGALVAGMAATKMPEGYRPPIAEVDWEGFKDRCRAEHNVRVVTDEEAGVPVDRTTPGVYGYTFAASFDNPVPIFVKPAFQAFEFHRLPDGEVVVLGCVRAKDAELLEKGEFVSLRLVPEPSDEAVVPVTVHYKHIVRSNNKVSRANGNYIEFDVKREG